MAGRRNIAEQSAVLVIGIISRIAGGQKINLDTALDDLHLSASEKRVLFAAIRQAVAAINVAAALSLKAFEGAVTVSDLATVVMKSLLGLREKVKAGRALKRAVRQNLETIVDPLPGDPFELPDRPPASKAAWARGKPAAGRGSRSAGPRIRPSYTRTINDLDLETSIGDVRRERYVGSGGDDVAPAGVQPSAFPESSPAGASAAPSSEPIAPRLVPATERQINIWVGDGAEGLQRALKIGETYLLNFKIGHPVSGSLTSGTAAAVAAGDVPAGGLWTHWMVVAQGAELAAGTPGTDVSAKTVDGISTWSGRFTLVIPEAGDSAVPQLKVKPLRSDPSINVVITTSNEIYRQFKLQLVASHSPSAAPIAPTAIADEVMPTPTAQSTLRTTHEWTTPNGTLLIAVGQPLATVVGNSGGLQIASAEPWVGAPALVSGKIKNVRDAAEVMRASWENHLNDIDPTDLANRLKRWSELNQAQQFGQGGPEYDWNSLGDHADPQHRQQWEKMSVSPELRKLALQGQQLFLAFFPRDSKFNGWIAGLEPGARLNILCTPLSGTGFIPHVPWGLMYVADVPPEGRPIDPMGFLGLRCRLEYTSHAAQASRSLGALDATHRMHFLYWGDGPNDVTGQEARWQRTNWSAWQNQIFVPQSEQNAKAELLALLNDPRPAPTSVLYLFCQCGGQANNPMLRFGSTNDPANVVLQTDFGTSALADRPLVFANACTTLANDPYMASELEEAFFDRGCRAYIGTETKVPIVFGSRFAEIFFRFFYRLLDSKPMAAGEAVAQTRLFLWTHYRNIGGLFYTHVNQYDLFLARDDEVAALR